MTDVLGCARFPIDPLYAFVPTIAYGHNNAGLAVALGLDTSTVRQWERRGLGTIRADQVAIKLGVHPSAVWTDWFASVADEPICRWCGDRTAGSPTCSKRCRYLAYMERRRVNLIRAVWWVRIDRYRDEFSIETDEPKAVAA